MEKLARKIEDWSFVYEYHDGAEPHRMLHFHFMGLVKNDFARYFYTGNLGYEHEVKLSKDTLVNLTTKGYCKFRTGTMRKI